MSLALRPCPHLSLLLKPRSRGWGGVIVSGNSSPVVHWPYWGILQTKIPAPEPDSAGPPTRSLSTISELIIETQKRWLHPNTYGIQQRIPG